MLNANYIDAVVMDLDGTLLTSSSSISIRSRAAIEKVIDFDLKVIIATGRPPRGLEVLPFTIRDRGSFICYNGAMIISENNRRHDFVISKSLALDIVAKIRAISESVPITFEVNDKWYSVDLLSQEDVFSFGSISDTCTFPLQADLDFLCENGIHKIMVPNVSGLLDEVSQNFRGEINGLCTDHGRLIQIMGKMSSKENALKILFEELGIAPERTIAFGDDLNDVGMMKYCGYSVAMGNALEEVKAVARWLTSSNDLDGLAEVLEKITSYRGCQNRSIERR